MSSSFPSVQFQVAVAAGRVAGLQRLRGRGRGIEVIDATHIPRNHEGCCLRRGEKCELLERLGLLILAVSSLISDFPKNISVPSYPKSALELFASHPT